MNLFIFNSKSSPEDNQSSNQTHRRYIDKLQSLLTQVQCHFDTVNKQIDANWSTHLQKQKECDRDRMRVPSLEAVYQTLAKQYQILMKEKEKINKIKAKLGVKTDPAVSKIKYVYSKQDSLYVNDHFNYFFFLFKNFFVANLKFICRKMNSLIDSMVSMTVGDQIKNERKILDAKKLDELRKATLSSRNIRIIKPSRPERNGLNSEVIIEKKLAEGKCNYLKLIVQP